MIELELLKEYVKLLENSSLSTIEISDEVNSVRLEKQFPPELFSGDVPKAGVIGGADGPTAVYVTQTEQNAPAEQSAAPAGDKFIKAPIVGVFYAAPAPDRDAYVSVGKKVKKGDIVCIIEAMKCMNEIQAEEDGEITEILAVNGELVEYDQPLFRIK